MAERIFWTAVAFVIAAVGVLGLTQAGGFDYEEGGEDVFRLLYSLVAAILCGGPLLSGLALVRQRRLRRLAAALVVSTPVTYTLLEIGIWDGSFGERHDKLEESVVIVALALALIGALFAMTRFLDRASVALTLATTALIGAAAILGLVLIGQQDASDASLTAVEVLTVLAVTGFFLSPVVERAIGAGPGRGPAPPLPSSEP
jgi:hypothetical protein